MQWNTSLTWVASSPMMPQSARSLDNRFSKASSFFGRLSKRVRQSHSLCLSTKFYSGIQSRHRSHLPVRCRDLGSLPEADKATRAVSPTLLALNPWHQMARLCVKRRSSQESQSAQHRIHLASGAAVLGWPRHKDETLACPKQSSASFKKKSMIVVLQESVLQESVPKTS